MEIEIKAFGTGSSMSVEEDLPVLGHPGSPEVANGHKSYPPSPLLLLAPASNHEEQVEAVESSHHVITIPEPVTCSYPYKYESYGGWEIQLTLTIIKHDKICNPDDDDEQNDVLVELGCSCKNEMSRMHRKCILEWYGMRMLLQNDHNCELCKTSLHMDTIVVVTEAVSDHENGGRAILLEALKSQLTPLVWIPDIERALHHDELVELLMATKFDFIMRLQALQAARTFTCDVVANGQIVTRDDVVPTGGEIVSDRPGASSSWHQYCWPFVVIFGLIGAIVGGYLAAIHHYSRN